MDALGYDDIYYANAFVDGYVQGPLIQTRIRLRAPRWGVTQSRNIGFARRVFDPSVDGGGMIAAT